MHADMEKKLEGLGQFAEGPLGEMLGHCKDDGQLVRLLKSS